MNLFKELRTRNVFKVGIAYLVIGWVVVQIADTAFPAFGAPDWALRILMLFALLGFPIALVMAWALELTPKGVRRSGGSDGPIFLIAVVLVAGSLFWFFKSQPGEHELKPADPEPAVVDEAVSRVTVPSIAIIPFQNLSQDAANEPFTMGIHDDLLTKVSKIGALRTISRTSVLRYSGSTKSIPEIAGELGVANVLEGGVQRVGNNVRINVQLIDAATDEHLWAETYDRELSAASIFAIQSEIATAIAKALKATLSPDDERRLGSAPTDNLEALEAYFIGKQLADMRREDTITDAIGRFDNAIGRDPQFALAHAGLAYAWLLLPEYSATVDRVRVRQESEAAAARALELDPDLPEGLTVMAWNRLIHDYDWGTAEKLLRDALRVHPANTDALHWLSHVLSWQGRHAEALQLAQEAVDNDPFSPLMYMNLAYILMDAGDFDRSVELREATLRLRKNLPELWRNSWLTLLRAGRYEDATFAMS